MLSKISIPTPCTESWNAMAVSDSGAFCEKCQFEVIDFRGMEPKEIRTIFESRKGQQTCAKISSVELDLVNSEHHIWKTQSPIVFKSKFLCACMMAFGVSFFSGCSGDEKKQIHEVIQTVNQTAVERAGNCSENKADGGFTLTTYLGQMTEIEQDVHYNNYDAFGNYSVTTRMKGKFIDE